ncbi:hypothetical protein NKH18_29385 [Streptomyces sp. M10(2022)]
MIAMIRKLGGTVPEVFDDPDLLEMVMPRCARTTGRSGRTPGSRGRPEPRPDGARGRCGPRRRRRGRGRLV